MAHPIPSSTGQPAPRQDDEFTERLSRQYLLAVAGLSGAGAVLYGAAPVLASQRWLIGGTCAVLSLLAWGLARQRFGMSRAAAVLIVALGVSTAVAVSAVGLGFGLNAAALGFLALQIGIVSVLVSRRSALALTAASALLVLGLAALEVPGWRFSLPAATVPSTPLRVITHLLLLATGTVIGWVLARAVEHALREAQLREQRFAGLLAVAADWYWELDAQFRFTYLSEQAAGSVVVAVRRLGKTPWEIEGFGLDTEAMDAHRADLESHQPFTDLVLQRLGQGRAPRWFAVSGRPRFDDRGVFHGYWGVGRDITLERQTELASQASEARYRELFARSPSALVLHRNGLVLDANAAALQLFDVDDEAAFKGRNLLELYDEADGSRQLAAERGQALRQLPLGDSMPAYPFVLRTLRGHRVAAQVNSVTVDADGGPAILSIYHDETERLRLEAARLRSEALMTHLVATSPDLITLTDLATGRYVMVNEAFVRVSGWARDEAVGHTAVELGVWPDAEARVRFVRDVSEHGEVRDRAVEFVDRHGVSFSLLVSAARFTLEGRQYLVLNGRDVTAIERERLEREAIFRNASIGIAMSRRQVFQLANPTFEQMFGWAEGGLVGQPGSVVSLDDAAYVELGQALGPGLACGEAVEVERRLKRRDGSSFLCRLMARVVDPENPATGGTIWIAEDVTERRAVDQALARARDDAEAANRAKSAFLANTSHEIRTPLNGLVGLARLARQPGLDADRRAQYLQQIDDSAQALSGVISDILDLSKIEAGKLRLEAVDFDLHALLESIENGYAALAEGRALSLEMRLGTSVPRRVRGDPVRLRQVLSNFLSNALKFTEHGGVRVEVRAVAAGQLRFEVQDSGPGIEPSVQARLFKPFTQADVSTTRRFGGTGLGLSICRDLAELMGGQVGLDSTPGQGSRFWAQVPLPASSDAGPGDALKAAPDQPSPLAGLHVLVAEDNAVNMMIAVALLEQWGIVVTQAADGAQAVSAVTQAATANSVIDLVLMDVQMPVMGGYDATRALRQSHDASRLPIIALTAAALTSERDEALACGMNDFLTKPIDAQRLHDTLVRWRLSSRAAAL